MFTYLRAVVVPTAVYAASEDWASSGEDDLAHRIARAAGELAELMDGRPPTPAATQESVIPFAQQLAALRVPPRES
jgi:FMN reductase